MLVSCHWLVWRLALLNHIGRNDNSLRRAVLAATRPAPGTNVAQMSSNQHKLGGPFAEGRLRSRRRRLPWVTSRAAMRVDIKRIQAHQAIGRAPSPLSMNLKTITSGNARTR